MAKFPALYLWTDAYLADTGDLSTEEHGAYLLLLMAAWRSPGCVLPDDDIRLARYCRLGSKKWLKVRPTMLRFWTVDDRGWTQKRLLEEFARATMLKTQRSKAGQASALKRKKTPPTGDGTGRATNAQEPSPSPSPEPEPQEDGDDAEARFHRIGVKVLRLVGADQDPSCRLDYGRVRAWLESGASETIIYATVTRLMERKRDGPPGSLKYFDRALTQAVADQTDPLPKAQNNGPRPTPSDARDKRDTRRAAAAEVLDHIASGKA